jgi:hypothetical protein
MVNIFIFLNPEKKRKTLESLERVVEEREEFSYLKELTEIFYGNKSKTQKERVYYEIVDFALRCYNHLKKTPEDKNALIHSLYKTGIRELNLYNNYSQNRRIFI